MPGRGNPHAETEKLWTALQYSHSLRIAAALAGCDDSPSSSEALEQVAARLEEAYIVINSTIAFSSDTKRNILRREHFFSGMMYC